MTRIYPLREDINYQWFNTYISQNNKFIWPDGYFNYLPFDLLTHIGLTGTYYQAFNLYKEEDAQIIRIEG